VLDDVLVSAAQAHAALALAVRTGMASDFGNHAEPAQGSKLPGSLTGAARTCTPATSLLAEVRPGPDDGPSGPWPTHLPIGA